MEEIAVFLAIGAAAGWVSGLIIKGTFGTMGNMLTGCIGAFAGGEVFKFFGITSGGPLITATAGAAALLLMVGLVRRK